MRLHRTLYLKLILAYLLFFLLSFVMISALNSRMILNDLTRTRAESLYRESRLVATTYGSEVYGGGPAREDALEQLMAIDTYISAEIRIIDPNGRQVLDSRSSDNRIFEDFDPAAIGSYSLVSDFYGTYDEDYLSVFYPITNKYSVRGYVVIQMPMSDLYASRDRLLNISYQTMLFMYMLSLLVLVALTARAQVQSTTALLGTWSGKLGVGAMSLTIVLHLDQADGYVVITLDSPDQGAKGIGTFKEFLSDDSLAIKVEKHLVGRVPALKEVERMVAEAGELPAVMEY
jgi:hypothetical protein